MQLAISRFSTDEPMRIGNYKKDLHIRNTDNHYFRKYDLGLCLLHLPRDVYFSLMLTSLW